MHTSTHSDASNLTRSHACQLTLVSTVTEYHLWGIKPTWMMGLQPFYGSLHKRLLNRKDSQPSRCENIWSVKWVQWKMNSKPVLTLHFLFLGYDAKHISLIEQCSHYERDQVLTSIRSKRHEHFWTNPCLCWLKIDMESSFLYLGAAVITNLLQHDKRYQCTALKLSLFAAGDRSGRELVENLCFV